jgi:hypothetical protein
MAQSQYNALRVGAKTQEVVDYHHDEQQPGKPLFLLVPGALVALSALALLIWTIYAWQVDATLADDRAILFLVLLAPVYIGGVFLFSYGYELYDVPKAIRLTAIIVFITLAAVIIVAVLFALLGAAGKSSSSSRSSSSSSSRSSSSSGSSSSPSFGLGSSGGGSSSAGPIFLNLGAGSAGRQVVTHEVVHEVPVAPPPPTPITCPFCGRPYLAAENNFACPNCGAATPDNLQVPDVPTAGSSA